MNTPAQGAPGALTLTNSAPTMSSREIADLVESRHDSVKRTIERLAEQGAITLPPLVEVSNNGMGPKTVEEYRVGKRDSYVVVAQLSPLFTARLVDRWQELEDAARRAGPDPSSLTRLQLLQLATRAEEERLALEGSVARLAPKAAALDRLEAAGGSLCVTDAAKALKVPPRKLFAFLQERRWLYRRPGGKGWLGYQDKTQGGLVEHRVATVTRPDGSEKAVEQALITPKGLARLAGLLNAEARP